MQKGEMKRYIGILRLYFEQFGGLVMMGGDIDASSKGIAGIHIADNEAYLLVIVRRNGTVHKRSQVCFVLTVERKNCRKIRLLLWTRRSHCCHWSEN